MVVLGGVPDDPNDAPRTSTSSTSFLEAFDALKVDSSLSTLSSKVEELKNSAAAEDWLTPGLGFRV